MANGVISIERIRETERLNEFREFTRVITGFMSFPLYLLFWLADLLYAPHLKWEFLFLRVLIIPVCIFVYFSINKITKLNHAQILDTILCFANSILITFMIYLTEGAISPYYAGLNLVAIPIIAFIPWTMKFLILNISLIYGPLILGIFFFPNAVTDYVLFILNLFFIFGTIALSLIIRVDTEKLRKKEVASKFLLEKDVKYREKIIEEKTNESLKLKTLTRQFSPQVVQAISSGKLDIIKSIHRAQICAIFIDIVDSTKHIVHIDKESVNKVLTLFIEDTMKVLLKYDITLDKFLGDGVLAFSNDPIKRVDFVDRVILAAMEIRTRINRRSEEYKKSWKDVLEVRFGISSGYADVGFYGSDKSFKSYTAIGRVIDLTKSLSDVGAPGQIVVSQDVTKLLSDSKFLIKKIGHKKLKSFESDIITVYEVDSLKLDSSIETAVEKCPNGHGILHLEMNMNGIYIFKCRTCGYEYSL
ncbi:MAG: adenylate/guanylate cyclase domain-containing protein [Pseudomonadota bacterium]